MPLELENMVKNMLGYQEEPAPSADPNKFQQMLMQYITGEPQAFEHQSFTSPYQQFQQQYPAVDQYGRKVASGGFLKENAERFAQAGADARASAFDGSQIKTGQDLLDYFGFSKTSS